MTRTASDADHDAARTEALRAVLKAHQLPLLPNALCQIGGTFLPYFALITAMYAMSGISPWLTLLAAVPAAGLVVRIFIIQHDCGHGGFFRSPAANLWLGRCCSLITMTPYGNWRRQHANHHAVWNNLDRRQAGADIYSTCLTVGEYRAMPARRRFFYRLLRHPLVSGVLLPPLVFMLIYRVPFDTPPSWRRERNSVLLTNAALALLFVPLALWRGAGTVALVQVPIMAIAAIIGVWLFSVQHRFENALWAREATWQAGDAALRGSSHLRLPRILQWLSGNIGFHHIHHMMPRIPNYRLEACHTACGDMLAATTSLSVVQALGAPSYALWDEAAERMVRFRDVEGKQVLF
jgi:omega-6 fatty acid desaturase (delta-12 desaturase)